MITKIRKKILSIVHPLLKAIANSYLSKTRTFTHNNITVKVFPGVFHPGLFFSTKLLIEFMGRQNIRDKRVLELGAGSGLLSLFCAKQGAQVTASDINPTAIKGIESNAKLNQLSLKVVLSDLFEHLSIHEFDIILINPPYYPRNPEKLEDRAWFCGEDFNYFKNLFSSLGKETREDGPITYMILSEDCAIETILNLAKENGLASDLIFRKKVKMENNFIYKISHNVRDAG